jgi:hypothetical protein
MVRRLAGLVVDAVLAFPDEVLSRGKVVQETHVITRRASVWLSST